MTYRLHKLLPYTVAVSWLFIIAELFYGFYAWRTLQFFLAFNGGAIPPEDVDTRANAVDQGAALAVQFYVFVAIATFVINAVWIYRASRNASDIDPDPGRITPKGAVLWHFVPFANYWLPYRAMRQVWNTSVGNADIDGATPGYFRMWWWAWAVSIFVGNVLNRTGKNSNSIETAMTTLKVELAILPVSIISAVLFIRLMKEITNAQKNSSRAAVFD